MANENYSEVTMQVIQLLRKWEEEHTATTYDPIPTLEKFAEIIEIEFINYLKIDPDPFDERHPSRVDPECNLGHILKVLFRKDNFMTKLINDYMRETFYRGLSNPPDVRKLNTAACRLMLDILPGLDTSAVFSVDMESLIQRLFSWAENSEVPLQCYATGLLAAAMEIQDIAKIFREQNERMVPLMLKRLRSLEEKYTQELQQSINSFGLLFGKNNNCNNEDKLITPTKRKFNEIQEESIIKSPNELFFSDDEDVDNLNEKLRKKPRQNSCDNDDKLTDIMSPPLSIPKSQNNHSGTPTKINNEINKTTTTAVTPSILVEDNSNSSWAELECHVIGNIKIYPPNLSTQQILILRYLTPIGQYQEFLGHVFGENALELILKYINIKKTKNSRLAFEALKYLGSLLYHKKFSIEFLRMNGLKKLLDIPRPSVAATGVSICLYYLSYCEDAMERICLMSKKIIEELVKYGLWLLETSHDSSRCHATMFFGLSYQFKIILDEFDAQDGLRKLINVITTLKIFHYTPKEREEKMNDDEEYAARQVIRHVVTVLKKYMEAHLYLKAEQLQRHENSTRTEARQLSIPAYKPCKLRSEEVQTKYEILEELMSPRSQWEPIEQLYKLQGIQFLIRILAIAYKPNTDGEMQIVSFNTETIKSCLDIIAICTISPKVITLLCDSINIPDIGPIIPINLLLSAADGELIPDPDIQRAALRTVVNCVCAPLQRRGSVSRLSLSSSAKKKSNNVFNCEEIIQRVWESVRSNNGIMILLDLMRVKLPIIDADSIRALACKALAGLSRSDKVRQIISKLSMFTTDEIQTLMKDPILQEKRQEHVTFQKYGLELMERVSGKSKPSGAEYEMSITSLHRANIVAQTRIQYDDKQLDQLIYQHLITKGYNKTAQSLFKEGNINSATLTGVKLQNNSIMGYKSPASNILYNTPRGGSRDILTTTRRNILQTLLPTPSSITTTSSSPIISTTTPLKIKLLNDKIQQNSPNNSQLSYPTTPNTSRSLEKSILREAIVTDDLLSSSPLLSTNNNNSSSITLSSIIKEYLTNQHALCKNPMVTCPQFNLFEPHKCPNPRTKYSSPLNMTVRVTRQQLGMPNRRLDRRHIYSRFCPVKTFRSNDVDSAFSYGIYTPCQQYLLLGTETGDVKMFNANTGVEEASYQCHDNHIKRLECNKKGNLLLTSTSWRPPNSALWTMDTMFDMKLQFHDESHVEFGKQNQNLIIGTQSDKATIYDVCTGKLLMTLKPARGNEYSQNKATFSMNDELVLSDGIIWDVNSGKEIHKFDKLNDRLNGVFHPNCTQVVSNSEVWDLRTFNLLNTVPELNQMNVIFSPINNIIYAVSCDREDYDENYDDSYLTSFRTFDGLDYSSIATFDVKKCISSLVCNKFDTQIAVVENVESYDSVQESQVRIYDVGRKRDDEDEEGEEDDDEDIDASDDNGSNTGSDDNDVQDGDIVDDNNSDDLDLADDDDDDDDGDLDDDDDDDDDSVIVGSGGSDDNDDDSNADFLDGYSMSDIEDLVEDMGFQ